MGNTGHLVIIFTGLILIIVARYFFRRASDNKQVRIRCTLTAYKHLTPVGSLLFYSGVILQLGTLIYMILKRLI